MKVLRPIKAVFTCGLLVQCWLVGTTAVSAEEKKVSSNDISPQLTRSPAIYKSRKVRYDTYILGAGDNLKIELLDLPELSGTFTIGPDGILYLPRLRALLVEGLTIEELRLFLTEQFKPYVREPQVYITPVGYRPVRVYVGG